MASTLDKPPRKDMTARAGADDSVSGGSRRTWRERLSWLDFKASPYLYISPFFLLFALTGLFPLIYTVFVAVHDWDLLSGQGEQQEERRDVQVRRRLEVEPAEPIPPRPARPAGDGVVRTGSSGHVLARRLVEC